MIICRSEDGRAFAVILLLSNIGNDSDSNNASTESTNRYSESE